MSRKRRTVRGLLSATLVLGTVLLLSGYATWNDRVLSGGVSGRQYWLDGSVGATLESEIYSAKWLWGNATALVSWGETGSKASAEMEFYQSSVGIGVCAFVNHYDTGDPDPIPVGSENWDYAKVIISPGIGGQYCPNYRGILTHEIGHVMGLAHVTSGTAIMRDDIAGLGWTAPKVDDVNGINHLY